MEVFEKNNILGCVYFKENVFGISIFNQVKHIVVEFILDNLVMVKLNSFIESFKISHIYVSHTLSNEKKILLQNNKQISIIFIKKENFKIKYLKQYDCLGIRAFNAMCTILKHYNCTNAFDRNKTEQNIISYFNGYPVEFLKNTNRMRFSSNTIKNLKIKNDFWNKLKTNCFTGLGMCKIKQQIMFPFVKEEKIIEKHLFNKRISENYKVIEKTLQKIHHIKSLKHIKSVNDLKSFFDSLMMLLSLGFSIKKSSLDYLKNTLDFVLSMKRFNFEKFKENVEKTLDFMAKKLAVAYEINLSIVFIPQIGFLLESRELDELSTSLCSVSQHNSKIISKKDENTIFSHSTTFEWKKKRFRKLFFKIYDKFYYKTQETSHLDSQFGDITEINYAENLLIENTILQKIKHPSVLELFDFIGEIDASLSLIKNISKIESNSSITSIGQKIVLNQIGITQTSKNAIYKQIHVIKSNLTVHGKFESFCKFINNAIVSSISNDLQKNRSVLFLIEKNETMSSKEELVAFYSGIQTFLKKYNYQYYIN
ncbi:hypothetical protein EHP00_121 [Ecytonucleospora hepatopenaei]|uniref:Uncharacterized protein n=1 Tax=Ecytonucleospora hepatopenaei TaxID=646526 RepID=A0A1W0E605_9MICR|nr:hypothetical protein EHP00_121 [Ecytonucleospora hepatopenaei]